jgi:hypothetical protein
MHGQLRQLGAAPFRYQQEQRGDVDEIEQRQ